MTTLNTLIGGILLMLVLYTALSWSPLSAALRAIIASSLALIVYFLMIVGSWPGLDVVAMHISIFVISGLLLYLFSASRRKKTKLHWAPKILIGFFVMLAGINSLLLYISNYGLPPRIAHFWLPGNDVIHTGFSGVVKHGEEAAKAVSSELSRSHEASKLGWQVEIAGLQEPAQASQIVSVKVRNRLGVPLRDLQAELYLLRPGTTQRTAIIPLISKNAGEYSNVLDIPAKGRWVVEIVLSQRGQVMHHEVRDLSLQ